MKKARWLRPAGTTVPKRHEAAKQALRFLMHKYTPGSVNNADEFFTTADISKAITAHTGFALHASEIHQLMQQNSFSYGLYNGLQFTWLLKKQEG